MNGSGGATLIDYKTDTGFTGEVPPGYRQQMTIYRSALSRILALDESRISAKLVFLRHGKVVDL